MFKTVFDIKLRREIVRANENASFVFCLNQMYPLTLERYNRVENNR